MNPSTNPSALRSKRIITETLLQLMEKYPYKEITVKHILLETAVSRKTFYRNFSSKDDVLNSYIDSILYGYIEDIISQDEYSFIEILDIIFTYCEKYKGFLFTLRDNELLYILLIKLNILIPEIHKKMVRYGTESSNNFSHPRLSEYIVSFNIGGIWNIIVKWIQNDMRDSVNDIKKSVVCYLSNIKNIDLRDI